MPTAIGQTNIRSQLFALDPKVRFQVLRTRCVGLLTDCTAVQQHQRPIPTILSGSKSTTGVDYEYYTDVEHRHL